MVEERPNGDPMRVTLGEVNRNVLALRSDFREWTANHERGHETSSRWLITTAIAVGGLAVAIITAAAK